jgi:hypothetical protein
MLDFTVLPKTPERVKVLLLKDGGSGALWDPPRPYYSQLPAAKFAAAVGSVEKLIVEHKALRYGQDVALTEAWANGQPPPDQLIVCRASTGNWHGLDVVIPTVLGFRKVRCLTLHGWSGLDQALAKELFKAIAISEGCDIEELTAFIGHLMNLSTKLILSAVKQLRLVRLTDCNIRMEVIHALLHMVANGQHGKLQELDVRRNYDRDHRIKLDYRPSPQLVARARANLKMLKVCTTDMAPVDGSDNLLRPQSVEIQQQPTNVYLAHPPRDQSSSPGSDDPDYIAYPEPEIFTG